MTWYREINPDQEPFSPGMDVTKKRVLFMFNISVVKEPSETFDEEIAERLEDSSVGTRNTNIFIGPKAVIPIGDGPYLVINDTGGAPPTWIHNQNTPFMKNSGAQISVVATSYNAAMAMAYDAYNALVSVKNEELNPS